MRLAVGSDHAGFALKCELVKRLRELGHSVLDLGARSAEPSDYPVYALKVGLAIAQGRAERGLLVCGSGVGASIAANKIPGVRAALCHDAFSARQGVEDDDANVLCLGARVIGPSLASAVLDAWLAARFSGAERHRRRLGKVLALERRFLRR